MGIDDAGEYGQRRSPNTGLNALIGIATAVLLAFLPFSTVLGGAVAGYLQGGSVDDGLKVGALAGVLSMLPFALIGYGLVSVVGIFSIEFASIGFLVVSAFIGFLLLYVLLPFVIGGAIGAYVKRERVV